MATSRSLTQRLGDYLGSNRNLVGAGLGLAGLAATVPTGWAGPWWPVVVGGLYGIGTLVTPAEKAKLGAGQSGEAVAQAVQLRADLNVLVRRVARYGARLPLEVHNAFDRIEGQLRDILGRAEDLATEPEHLFVVGKTINSYLPTALQSYANLPDSFRRSHKGGNGRTPHEELLSQLQVLGNELGRVSEAVFAGDTQALAMQSAFLEERFTESSWDIRADG